MKHKSKNITTTRHRVARDVRWLANGHKGGVLWFTGLSGSGKTTLAFELEQQLFEKGLQAYVLDGDNIRHGLSADLEFSHEDRSENIRRIGEVASLFANAGLIVVSAFISPYQRDRQLARTAAGTNFHEIFLSASLDVCENRDPKGLYQMARQGKIEAFTGVSDPYEEPENPEYTLDTGVLTVEACIKELIDYVDRHFVLSEAP